jgi:hypothetical protein
MTLTYRRKWIEPALWAPGSLTGKRLLFALCSDPDNGAFRWFTPLRYAMVVATALSGEAGENSLLSLRVDLEQRPSPTALDTFTALIKASRIRPSLGDSLFLVRTETVNRALLEQRISGSVVQSIGHADQYAAHWAEQISRVKNRDRDLRQAQFARVESLQAIEMGSRLKRFHQPTLVQSTTAEATTVELRAGAGYELNFQIHQQSFGTGREMIAVTTVGPHIEIGPPLITQFGSDARVSFVLLTQRKFAPEIAALTATTVIQLQEPGPDPASSQKLMPRPGPEFQLRLRIGPEWYFWPFAVVPFALGTALLAMDRSVFANVCFLNPGLLAALSKMLGGLLVAVATKYAFNKLPIRV